MKLLIQFFANVNEQTINSMNIFITQFINRQNTQNPQSIIEEIIIEISSNGGSSDHGLLAYNLLKQISIPITTIGMGNVDSAAVLIFVAGDKRLSMPSCRFVLHQPIANIHGEFTAAKLQELADLTKRIKRDYINAIFADSSSVKIKKLETKIDEGKVLSSTEAKQYSIVTEIIDKPYLKESTNLNLLVINNPIQNLIQKPQEKNKSII